MHGMLAICLGGSAACVLYPGSKERVEGANPAFTRRLCCRRQCRMPWMVIEMCLFHISTYPRLSTLSGPMASSYHMSVKGRLWRLLYSAYVDLKCKVRVEREMSDWYDMQCRIHHGGYLLLTKYKAFVNELLVQLEDSCLCCSVEGVQSSPGGYADDLATASVSKVKIDKVLKI